jgi:hypothetical protein
VKERPARERERERWHRRVSLVTGRDGMAGRLGSREEVERERARRALGGK